jgi:fumarate reductase flavoprotein subunit
MWNAVLKQPGAFYWMVHDSKNIEPNSVTVQEYLKGGYLVKADTVEGLAAEMGVDAAVLQATIDQYNNAVATGKDELTGRTLLVATIDEGPYFAAKRVPSAHHTMGGVEIDVNTHVLDTEGNWIEGLYAAGEVCGDIHGGNRVGGNAVDDTVVFGRIAGANAATGE